MAKGRKKARKEKDTEFSIPACQAQPSNRLSCGRRWTVTEDSALREAVEKALARAKKASPSSKKKKTSPPSTPSKRKRAGNDKAEHSIDWSKIAKIDMAGHARSAGECFNRWDRVLKQGLVKGAFSKSEDEMIRQCIEDGVPRWSEIAEYIPGRVGKQCRERWYNHLDPSLKHNVAWLAVEDDILSEACEIWGSCWSRICKLLPGRSANMCKNRWNGSCRRKNKGFGSSKQDGPIFYLRCLDEDNEESVLEDLLDADDVSLDEEGIFILESARKAARALKAEVPGAGGSGDDDQAYSPDGVGGLGNSGDSDLVQVTLHFKPRHATTTTTTSSTTSSSRRVTPLPCPPLPAPEEPKRTSEKVGSRREFGKRINGKSLRTRRKRDPKKGNKPKLEQMPKLPTPTIDAIREHQLLGHEGILSPGSLLIPDEEMSDREMNKSEEEVSDEWAHDSSDSSSSKDDAILSSCRSKGSEKKKKKVPTTTTTNLSGPSYSIGKYMYTPKPLPTSLSKPNKSHKKSPCTPALSLLAEVSEKSPPLLESSKVPSCSVKWVNENDSKRPSFIGGGTSSSAKSASNISFAPNYPGPYDAFTPVVTQSTQEQQRLKKRLAAKCLDHREAMALHLKRSPISAVKVNPSCSGFQNKLSVLASTAEAASMLHDDDNNNNKLAGVEPGLDEEEMSASMKEVRDADGDVNETPVAQLVSKSFKANLVRTPVLNISSPSCVHHNDNILSIFKTPDEDKMLLLGGRHDWSSQDGDDFQSSQSTADNTSIGKMLEKPSLVPFTGRDIHATMGFSVGKSPSLMLQSKVLATQETNKSIPKTQSEDRTSPAKLNSSTSQTKKVPTKLNDTSATTTERKKMLPFCRYVTKGITDFEKVRNSGTGSSTCDDDDDGSESDSDRSEQDTDSDSDDETWNENHQARLRYSKAMMEGTTKNDHVPFACRQQNAFSNNSSPTFSFTTSPKVSAVFQA